ncbi:MAG: DUF1320 domain-containing protein [Syntrophobacteraceae bacterium]
MPYCTLEDILGRIEETTVVQLTDDEGLGSINTERVNAAIADADQEIDGYAGTRYAVPMNPAPPILRRLSIEIAIHNLFGRRSRKEPEDRTERYKGAVDLLKQIAAGRFSLGPCDPDGNPPASDAPQMAAENPERNFTRSSMRDF